MEIIGFTHNRNYETKEQPRNEEPKDLRKLYENNYKKEEEKVIIRTNCIWHVYDEK